MSELFSATLALVVAVFAMLFGFDKAPDRSEKTERSPIEQVFNR